MASTAPDHERLGKAAASTPAPATAENRRCSSPMLCRVFPPLACSSLQPRSCVFVRERCRGCCLNVRLIELSLLAVFSRESSDEVLQIGLREADRWFRTRGPTTSRSPGQALTHAACR